MSKIPVAFVEIRLFAHATEDLTKVTKAVKQIFPIDFIEEMEFKRTGLKGHYRNPIILFETKIKAENVKNAFIDSLFSRIGVTDKEELLREIDLHVEKGSLYLRLDKQAAFCGEIQLGTEDPIRIRIRFMKRGITDILRICKEFGMLP
ncbi:MAG: hypothetical protein OEX77_10465 [Candidatus Bathyarchaeota archaeon]|nr:hypothetical protein [Candidatus Bathyarchaeota archaeon]